MVYTTLNKIFSLSPSSHQWAVLLKNLGKEQPDDEPISLLQILEFAGLFFSLWCCQTAPEFDKQWRLYAVWCARKVKFSIFSKDCPIAINEAERFANGQITQAEFEKIQASTFIAIAMAKSPCPGKAAAATTHRIAGLAAREAAESAAISISNYAGIEAKILASTSQDEFVNYCNGNHAYDLAKSSAYKLAMEAQKNEFVRLVMNLKQVQ